MITVNKVVPVAVGATLAIIVTGIIFDALRGNQVVDMAANGYRAG